MEEQILAQLALSKETRYGYQLFYYLPDKPRGQQYYIGKPLRREYWKASQVEAAIVLVTASLQHRGYRVRLVSLDEYNQIGVAHASLR